ncbi:hypothetical protein RRG08_003039 [Elysia crispata]|uniref:Uncharacterized protein n=1 Tax=Elysia crispata TaxID=231223 RepID=A0AAE1B6U4_9GAST|nr:hypothetical protein RRG08_003039 [Elysia crispata]
MKVRELPSPRGPDHQSWDVSSVTGGVATLLALCLVLVCLNASLLLVVKVEETLKSKRDWKALAKCGANLFSIPREPRITQFGVFADSTVEP